MAKESVELSTEERELIDKVVDILRREDFSEDQKIEIIQELGDFAPLILHPKIMFEVFKIGSIKIFETLCEENFEKKFSTLTNSSDLSSLMEHFINISIESNNIKILEYISSLKPELLDSMSEFGESVLHIAIGKNSFEIVDFFMSRKPELIDLRDFNNFSVLFYAVKTNNLALIEYLIDINPDLIDSDAEDALHISVEMGYLNLVKYFISLNYSLIDTKIYGQSLLHLAAELENRKLTEYLLSAKTELIDSLNSRYELALHKAIKNGNIELVQYFLSIKPQLVNFRDDFGTPILHYAAKNSTKAIVEHILSIKPELINWITSRGESVLHLATKNPNVEVAKYLLSIKPELIDRIDNGGRSVLHLAAESGSKELLEYLLSIKPELIDQIDNSGESALHAAAFGDNMEAIEYLLSIKLELINAQDKKGNTPLHTYFTFSRFEAFFAFISKGSDLLMQNIENKTPADQINNPVIKAKYKKLEQIFIQLKTIFNEFSTETNFSYQKEFILKNIEYSNPEDKQYIVKFILNLTKFELSKLISVEETDKASKLISQIFDIIPLDEFASYKAMINQYEQIKEWEIGKGLAPKYYLLTDIFKVIEEFLEPEDVEILLSELPKTYIADYRDVLLKFDYKAAGEMYEKLKIINDKVIAKIVKIFDTKMMDTQEVEGDQADDEDDQVEGGAEESKGGEPSALPMKDESDSYPVNQLLTMLIAVQMSEEASSDAVSELQPSDIALAGAGAGSAEDHE